jgi:hypothetical protein
LKILPSNQSLILAGEPGGPRGRPAASSTALQRVTILTARQNTTVVVQADYFSHDAALPLGTRLAQLGAPANDAAAADAANLANLANLANTANSATPSGAAKSSSYLNPIELYQRTQRGLKDSSKPALLDVLA